MKGKEENITRRLRFGRFWREFLEVVIGFFLRRELLACHPFQLVRIRLIHFANKSKCVMESMKKCEQFGYLKAIRRHKDLAILGERGRGGRAVTSEGSRAFCPRHTDELAWTLPRWHLKSHGCKFKALHWWIV